MRSLFTLVVLFTFISYGYADEVYLKNGDKITGNIIFDSTTRMIIETEAMGEVTINRDHVKEYQTDFEMSGASIEEKLKEQKEASKDVQWTRTIGLDYTGLGGNTDESYGTLKVSLNRKTDRDEATFRLRTYFKTEDNKLDRKQFYGLTRYARSFGKEKKWYHFVKIIGDKDTEKNIDYRVIPAYGAGYWFFDEEDFKLTLDSALGWEYTKYDDESESNTEVVLTPHAYFERTFRNGLTLSEDLLLYPSIEDFEKFRYRSQTELSGKITERLSWVVGFLSEYDSEPRGDDEKSDYKISTGIEYEF